MIKKNINKNKFTIIKMILLISILISSVFMLSSCNSQNILINTKLNFNPNFEGSRVITCTFPFFNMSDEDSISQLDKIISQGCPKEMSYNKSIDNGKLNYTFKLDFTSINDYSKKINSITNEKKHIVFSNPNSIFTKGMFLKENFDSKDLLMWIKTTAKKLNYDNIENFNFDCSNNSVVVDDIEHNSNKLIEYRNLKGVPVDYIKIDTISKGNDNFTRTVLFKIPKKTMKELGIDVISYMNARSDKAVCKTWTEYNSGSIYEVTFNASSTKQLSEYTNKILNSSNNGSIIYSKDYDITNLLNDESVFQEILDLSNYVGFENRPVNVKYSYVVEENSKLNEAYVTINGNKKNIRCNNKLNADCEAYTDTLLVNIKDGGNYNLISTDITLEYNGDDKFTRDMSFTFNDENLKATEHIKKLLSNMGSDILIETEQNDYNSICHLIATGSPDEITNKFSYLFGDENSFGYESENAGIQVKKSTIMTDKINLSQIYSGENTKPKITYNIITNGKDQINNLLTLKDNKKTNIKINNKERISFSLTSPDISVIYNGNAPNFIGIILYIFLMLLVIVAVLGIIFLVKKGYFRNHKKCKKNISDLTEEEICDILSDI